MASDVFVQQLTAGPDGVKSQLALVTLEKLELAIKLNSVKTESDRRLELLTTAPGAHNRVENFVRSVVGYTVWSLDASVNRVGILLVDWF